MTIKGQHQSHCFYTLFLGKGLDAFFPYHSINYDYLHYCGSFARSWGRAGCMYMGDYEAKGKKKWLQYESHFKQEIPLLHLQQLPHHGAHGNYNDNLNNLVKINFVSAGKKNSYGHPSNYVLQALNINGIPWIWLHEYSSPKTFRYLCIR